MRLKASQRNPFFLLAFLLTSLALIFLSGKNNTSKIQPTPTPGSGLFLVTKVIDGDTIELESGDKVRYIGIDAPESTLKKECYGKESSAKNKELVEGKRVRLESDITDRDRYGRLLRYVYLDKDLINEVLVREGFASSFTYPPDVKLQDLFIAAQKEARETNRGLWGICTNVRGDTSTFIDRDCKDFKTQKEAIEFYISQGGPEQDPHNLDTNKDGKVCENLH